MLAIDGQKYKYNHFFEKLESFLHNEVHCPILPTKHPALRSGRLRSKIGLGNPWKSKTPSSSL